MQDTAFLRFAQKYRNYRVMDGENIPKTKKNDDLKDIQEN